MIGLFLYSMEKLFFSELPYYVAASIISHTSVFEYPPGNFQ